MKKATIVFLAVCFLFGKRDIFELNRLIRMGGLWVFSMLACNMALLLDASEFFIIHIGRGILLAQDRRLYFRSLFCIVHPLRCEYSV
jgi:hypothetical protein